MDANLRLPSLKTNSLPLCAIPVPVGDSSILMHSVDNSLDMVALASAGMGDTPSMRAWVLVASGPMDKVVASYAAVHGSWSSSVAIGCAVKPW